MRKLAVLALSALALVLAGSTSAAQPRNDVKNFQHVFVIMMENTGYDTLVGNPNAPWINAAIAKYGVATNYFGAAHPSQPNYIASTAGITGPFSDNDETLAVPNLVDQLEANGKTWTAYMQSYSLCHGNAFAHACGNQLYERKHNPFITFADVQASQARIANIVDFSQFSTDLANNTVSDYSWISPDQCHDMHGRAATHADPCDFSNQPLLVQAGDAFLANTVTAIQDSPAWNGNSVIFITWDESDFTGSGPSGFGDTSGCCDAVVPFGGGHVLTLVISHSDHQSRQSNVAYNHYSMLRTIEDGWRLGCVGFTCDTANVPAMTDLVGPKG